MTPDIVFTPPFVRWTLALKCPLKEFEDCENPERIDRLLRGVRCHSDALAEDRVAQGVVLEDEAFDREEPLGFPVDAVLEPLGGLSFIEQQCGPCPANAIRRVQPQALAGCVGFIVPPPDFITPEGSDPVSPHTEFVETHPRWFGLWIDAQLTSEKLLAHHKVLSDLAQQRREVVGLRDYLLAVDAAIDHSLPLVVQAYPGGRCEGRKWLVEAHCSRCKAGWPEARRQQCRVCGTVGGRQAERVRKRIGIRPFRPLSEFLSEHQQATLHQMLMRRNRANELPP